MAAVVLASLVNYLRCVSGFLHADSICGAGVDTTRGQQQSTVAKFNQGEVECLFFTSFMCEGNI